MNNFFEPFMNDKAKQGINKMREDLKFWKKQYKKKLSEEILQIHCRSVQLSNGKILHAGDIICRPIKEMNDDYFLNLNLYHCGIVCGTTKEGEQLILEANPENDISIVQLTKFLSGYLISDIWEQLTLSKESTHTIVKFETIMQRAEELEYEGYSSFELNCQHLVNYCIYGKKESKGAQNIAKLLSLLIKHITTNKKYGNSIIMSLKEVEKKLNKIK